MSSRSLKLGTMTRMAGVSSVLISNINLVDAQEIMRGITIGLGLSLSREEIHILTNYFDKDGDARVTYQEFSSKISIKDVPKQSARYLISAKYFTDQVICSWF